MSNIPKLWDGVGQQPKLTYTDLHLHTEYSLKDGMIRIADHDDPKHVKKDIILNAEYRNTGVVTATDHGNMYGQAILASVAKNFGMKHIAACEFYIATGSRHDKAVAKGTKSSRHINGWARNKAGYENLCSLQKIAYNEGFYHVPRIDKEVLDKYGDNIIWSDACIGGTLSALILEGREMEAYMDFMWYIDRFKDNFYMEYQNHGMEEERFVNEVKIEWANRMGVPVIATTDAHFYKKDQEDAHKILLAIQYGRWADDPTFCGFGGDGYWLMSNEELLARYPVEYLNNTQLIVDKCDQYVIEFGKLTPPRFDTPRDFKTEMMTEVMK